MRVLVVANDFPSPQRPQAGVFVLRQIQALRRFGHEFLVVRAVPHAPPWTSKWRAYRSLPDRDLVENVPVTTLRAYFLPRRVAMEYLPLQLGAALRRVAAEFQPDLVHAHFLLPAGQLATSASAAPVILTAHGSDAYEWAWQRAGLRRAATDAVSRANTVVAVSDFIRRHVCALVRRNVHVVYNGADDGVFAPTEQQAARFALGIAANRFVVAFTGGLSRAKGVYDLIDAAARLRTLRPLLLLAGPTTERARVHHAIAAAGVEARILGVLAHPDVARLLGASDVFCLPSYREGLPAALCEAMLCGLPVLATPVGGIPEIVADGTSGFLVSPGDAEKLAERMAAIARRRELAAQLGKAAHRFAREHLTWNVNAHRYDELYRAAAGTRRAQIERLRIDRSLSNVPS